ncbi:hypothetical protein M9458_021128, partial [Cirrhinus mrigala]
TGKLLAFLPLLTVTLISGSLHCSAWIEHDHWLSSVWNPDALHSVVQPLACCSISARRNMLQFSLDCAARIVLSLSDPRLIVDHLLIVQRIGGLAARF